MRTDFTSQFYYEKEVMMRKITIFSTVCLLSLSAFTEGRAQTANTDNQPQLTLEQRESMAKAHEKMAACLRSKRPVNECHSEMMESCKQHGALCPMMGQSMGYGHGAMHGKGTKTDGKPSTP